MRLALLATRKTSVRSARKTRSAKKKKPEIATIVRKAVLRELVKMQSEPRGYLHDGWTGAALASWIAPGIIRSVERALASRGKANTKSEGR